MDENKQKLPATPRVVDGFDINERRDTSRQNREQLLESLDQRFTALANSWVCCLCEMVCESNTDCCDFCQTPRLATETSAKNSLHYVAWYCGSCKTKNNCDVIICKECGISKKCQSKISEKWVSYRGTDKPGAVNKEPVSLQSTSTSRPSVKLQTTRLKSYSGKNHLFAQFTDDSTIYFKSVTGTNDAESKRLVVALEEILKHYKEKKASALSIAPRHAASSTQVSIGSRSQQMVQLATRQNVASTTRGAVAPSSVPSSQIFSRSPPKKPLIGDFEDKENLFTDWSERVLTLDEEFKDNVPASPSHSFHQQPLIPTSKFFGNTPKQYTNIRKPQLMPSPESRGAKMLGLSAATTARCGYSWNSTRSPLNDLSTEKKSALVGFSNLGNTCYMNAILQALCSLDCFVIDLLKACQVAAEQKRATSAKASLSWHLQKLIILKRSCEHQAFSKSRLLSQAVDVLKSTDGVRSQLANVKRAISTSAKRFCGDEQHDAHEFLSQVLDQLKDETDSDKSAVALREDKTAVASKDDYSTLALKDDDSLLFDDDDSLLFSDADDKSSKDDDKSSVLKDDEPLILKDDKSAVALSNDTNKDGLATAVVGCVSKALPPSPVVANFEFEVTHYIKCAGCEKTLTKTECFNDLSVNIPFTVADECPLEECLGRYFADEVIEYQCEQCQGRTSVVSHSFSKLPRVLILHLKRYTYDETQSKVSKPVVFPSQLSLQAFSHSDTSIPNSTSFSNLKSCKRKLESVDTANFKLRRTSAESNPSDIRSMFGSKHLTVAEKQNSNKPFSDDEDFGSIDSQKYTEDMMLAEVLSRSLVETKGPCSDNAASNIHYDSDDDLLMAIPAESNCASTPTKLSRTADDGSVRSLMDEFNKELSPKTEREENEQLRLALERSLQESEMNALSEADIGAGSTQVNSLENLNSMTYQLMCVISHLGSTSSSGHYVSDVYSVGKKSWLSCDDSYVRKVLESDIFGRRKHTGYVFFYMHKDTLSKVASENSQEYLENLIRSRAEVCHSNA